MKGNSIIEIEVDGTRNENLLFLPLARRVRGRFEFRRVKEPLAMVKATGWPGDMTIPGQRMQLNLETGAGYILEPLHDAEHVATADKIRREGFALAKAREEFKAVHVPTWLYWIKRAVESGTARVVQGKLPEKVEGKPRTDFFGAHPTEDPRDKLIGKLIDMVAGLLPEEKRAELLAGLQQ
jgi:hypothetical protein